MQNGKEEYKEYMNQDDNGSYAKTVAELPNEHHDGKTAKKGGSSKLQFIALILLFVAGLSILLYPTVSNLWNQWIAHQMIGKYDKAVKQYSPEDFQEMIRAARKYNRRLGKEAVPDAFAVRSGVKDAEYESLLDVAGNGMMGSVRIPSIGVDLPIYHYTTKDVLEKGVGHLLGSSLPVGGKGSHSVVSAHRGLPSMKLFTDLNLLKEGDKFFYTILDKNYAYEIDSVDVVRPSDTSSLAIVKDEDLSTLVTCTPYGVNSHRLLVHGHRVPYVPEDENVENRSSWIRDLPLWAVIVAAIVGLAIGILIVRIINARRKRKTSENSAAPNTGNDEIVIKKDNEGDKNV